MGEEVIIIYLYTTCALSQPFDLQSTALPPSARVNLISNISPGTDPGTLGELRNTTSPSDVRRKPSGPRDSSIAFTALIFLAEVVL